MTAGSRTPETVAARGEARKLFGFGFGRRFFLALGLGLVWLVPAWSRPSLAWGLVVWDVLVLVVWLWDLLQLPNAGELQAERSWGGKLSLAAEATVGLRVSNAGRVAITVDLIEHTPAALRDSPAVFASDGGGGIVYGIELWCGAPGAGKPDCWRSFPSVPE